MTKKLRAIRRCFLFFTEQTEFLFFLNPYFLAFLPVTWHYVALAWHDATWLNHWEFSLRQIATLSWHFCCNSIQIKLKITKSQFFFLAFLPVTKRCGLKTRRNQTTEKFLWVKLPHCPLKRWHFSSNSNTRFWKSIFFDVFRSDISPLYWQGATKNTNSVPHKYWVPRVSLEIIFRVYWGTIITN